jgi:hypothetical protein
MYSYFRMFIMVKLHHTVKYIIKNIKKNCQKNLELAKSCICFLLKRVSNEILLNRSVNNHFSQLILINESFNLK